MKKWIEELEKKAQNAATCEPGTLLNSEPCVCYYPPYDADEVTLDGDFTSGQLIALAQHMLKYNGD